MGFVEFLKLFLTMDITALSETEYMLIALLAIFPKLFSENTLPF